MSSEFEADACLRVDVGNYAYVSSDRLENLLPNCIEVK